MIFNSKEYVAKRNQILLYGTPDMLMEFMQEHGRTPPTDREIVLMIWHKVITSVKSLPFDYRMKSKEWLTRHHCHSLDDGELG